MKKADTTALEQMREEMSLSRTSTHRPQWRIEHADDRFAWVFDEDRAVALLDKAEDAFELRCHGPADRCPLAEVPRYYHMPNYDGARITYTWRFPEKLVSSNVETEISADAAVIRCRQKWADGTHAVSTIHVRFDCQWDAYVADVETLLTARRVTTALEYCNVLPGGISDSRPGRERYPFTFWQHPAGLRKMLKNPLWFTSVGAQDLMGEKHIRQGGFIGFGPDDHLNQVIELVYSDPETGATTCDALQDEHVMVFPAEGRHAMQTGWHQLEARYRFFSIPRALADELVERADFMTTGPMLAWKFQYPPLPELPADLTNAELPGSPFYGRSDWSRPVPWDKPFNGMLWTPSPDPQAAIHYDRGVGREQPGSIRLRVDNDSLAFWPGSGHTLHVDEGVTYRYSMWIKTEGDARGWIEAIEMLFRIGDRESHCSTTVGPNQDWTRVEVAFTGKGEEAPFACPSIGAEGAGQVWFTDMAFEAMTGEGNTVKEGMKD